MNRAEEDYIKTIYELSINKDAELVKNNDIAERLGFTDQSVNEMVKKLANKGFVDFIPYKGVKLTKKGYKEAVRMIRAHRVWEVFLSEHLNFSWEEIHEQAEMLEHAGSEELINRLYDYIGKPKYCGHGNPIPSMDGIVINNFNKPLIDFNVDETFKLKRVLDVKELLLYLDENNLKINDEFVITEKNDFTNSITLKKDNSKFVITNKIAKMIFGI